MAKKDIKKHEGLSQADLERLELLQKANEKTGRQFVIFPFLVTLKSRDFI